MTPVMTEPPLDYIIGRYRILHEIGKGGMGKVYSAVHIHTGKRAAVKVLLPGLLADLDDREKLEYQIRFKREAQMASNIDHDNVVQILDFDAPEDEPAYLVMELLTGTALDNILSKENTISLNRSITLMSQLFAGLLAAHNTGIIHRDLKPQNIIVLPPAELNGKEKVKIIDFGLARAFDADRTDLTRYGQLLGSPKYLSPEQCRADPGLEVDVRADIYSAGMIFYHILAGKLPFSSTTLEGWIRCHLDERPENLPDTLPAEIRKLIMSCLEKDRENRPQSVTSILHELSGYRNTGSNVVTRMKTGQGTEELMTTDQDIEFMRMAIDASRKCKSEPGKTSPMVGAVVVKGGKVLATAYRGQMAPGQHAEYTALEQLLGDEVVAGSTVYTTLEPCTQRNHPKLPCAEHLAARKVKRVVVGMLDPNPAIKGKGVIFLRDRNISVALFPDTYASEVEELNRAFRRFVEQQVIGRTTDERFLEKYRSRGIDEWYKASNYIFLDRNFYRDPLSIFAHLVEIIGGLSHLASGKLKPGVTPEAFMPKAIAWWFTVCGKLGIISVSDLLWRKFPARCPYCQKEEHDAAKCKREDARRPDWPELERLGKGKVKPKSLGEWQRMFRTIYKQPVKPDFETALARLAEELGEFAEAIRVFPFAPGYVLSEAADVFAWLMNIQNNIDYRNGTDEPHFGDYLEELYCSAYPDYCIECRRERCICPPILESTIGRIAHEIPPSSMFNVGDVFMTTAESREVFKPQS